MTREEWTTYIADHWGTSRAVVEREIPKVLDALPKDGQVVVSAATAGLAAEALRYAGLTHFADELEEVAN